MRDPDGFVKIEGDFVIRRLNKPVDATHFLHSALAKKWVKNGDLIPYEWIDSCTLRSPKLPFLTLPSEWSAPQFFAAARLTLRLQAEAVQDGWDLKDASAWNIVFDGLRPIFVDLLSFVPLRTKLWRAASQLNRHFILPLLLAKRRLLEPHQCMKLWRDGISPTDARNLIGASRFITRYWPLMADPKSSVMEDISGLRNTQSPKIPPHLDIKHIQNFRSRLHVSLEWMLSGVSPSQKYCAVSTWGQYEQDRDHYQKVALDFKRQIVRTWLHLIKPLWALDIGCNAGEFSEFAVEVGARTICWDSDSQAMATLFERHIQGSHADCYYPILGPVDDAPGGRGWMGAEFPNLLQRLNQKVEVVMLLAVTHHLAIAGGVRLADIFRFAAIVTRRALILELLSEADQRVQQLCLVHNRDPKEFTIEKQRDAAISAGFRVIHHAKRSPDETREFLLMEIQGF